MAPPTRTSPTTGRHRTFPDVTVVLPDPIGEVEVRFRNPDLADVEDDLDDLLVRARERYPDGHPWWVTDRNPDGLRPDNVWDALNALTHAWPMRTVGVLLHRGTRAADVDKAELDELPPSVYDDEELVEGLMTAIAYAFGMDPADVEGPPTNRAERRAAARSTGKPSSQRGPAPSRSAGSDNPPRPSTT